MWVEFVVGSHLYSDMVATGQEMVREKILQGQENFREFYSESGKIGILKKSVQGKLKCKTDSMPSKVGRSISGQMGAKDFCNRRLEATTIFEILHLFGRET